MPEFLGRARVGRAVLTALAACLALLALTASSAFAVNVVTAPGKPSLTSDSGASSTDNITKVSKPTFSGARNNNAAANITLYAQQGSATPVSLGGVTGTSSDYAGGGSVTLADGTWSIYAKAGTLESERLSITIDTTRPMTAIPDMVASSDSGESSTDNITNENRPYFAGFASELAKTQLMIDEANSDVEGGYLTLAYLLRPTALADGVHTARAFSTDLAGNVGAMSARLYFTIDTAGPTTSVPDMTPGSDTGASNGDNITKNNAPTFQGTTNESAKTRLFINANGDGSEANAGDAVYALQIPGQSDGNYQIAARSTDVAGNQGAMSNALAITIDTQAPTTSTPDLIAASDTGLSDTDNVTADDTPTFQGDASEKARTRLVVDTVNNVVEAGFGDAAYLLTSTALSVAFHDVQAFSTDVAGNVGGLSGTLRIEVVDAGCDQGPASLGTNGDDQYVPGDPGGLGAEPTTGGDRFIALDGNDFLRGLAGDDCLIGGPGDDQIYGEAGNDRLDGGPGNDEIIGGDGANRLYGGPGNDHIVGGPDTEIIISGGPGDDTIDSRDGNPEIVDCGPGNDFVRADPTDTLIDCEPDGGPK